MTNVFLCKSNSVFNCQYYFILRYFKRRCEFPRRRTDKLFLTVAFIFVNVSVNYFFIYSKMETQEHQTEHSISHEDNKDHIESENKVDNTDVITNETNTEDTEKTETISNRDSIPDAKQEV